jgi:hypothetical protein
MLLALSGTQSSKSIFLERRVSHKLDFPANYPRRSGQSLPGLVGRRSSGWRPHHGNHGRSSSSMSQTELAELMRRPVGTLVHLGAFRNGSVHPIALTLKDVLP